MASRMAAKSLKSQLFAIDHPKWLSLMHCHLLKGNRDSLMGDGDALTGDLEAFKVENIR